MTGDEQEVDFDQLPYEDNFILFVGREVSYYINEHVSRIGIINEIVKTTLGTAKAVILWDTDHSTEKMLLANSDNSFEDLSVGGCVSLMGLNLMHDSPRWKIYEEEWYGVNSKHEI